MKQFAYRKMIRIAVLLVAAALMILPRTEAAIAGAAGTLPLIAQLPDRVTPTRRAPEPCSDPISGVIVNGKNDSFREHEPTFQGPNILAMGSGPWAPFDYLSPDRQFGHTMTGLPCDAQSATLTLYLQSTSTLSSNDTIALGGTGGVPRFQWSRRVKDVLGQSWNNPGDTAVLVLDLNALPLAGGGTTSIISLMNSSGELDIYMQDDTAVDYMELSVSTCVGQDCNQNGITDTCEDNSITFDCPADVTAYLETGCCVPVNLVPTARNLCGNPEGITITNDYDSKIGALSACFPVGTTVVTFTATDTFGNSVSCVTTVTIIDQTPPTILFCPEQ